MNFVNRKKKKSAIFSLRRKWMRPIFESELGFNIFDYVQIIVIKGNYRKILNQIYFFSILRNLCHKFYFKKRKKIGNLANLFAALEGANNFFYENNSRFNLLDS